MSLDGRNQGKSDPDSDPRDGVGMRYDPADAPVVRCARPLSGTSVEVGGVILPERLGLRRDDVGVPVVRRARPLLGTFVEIAIEGLDDPCAAHALAAAFAEVAAIHRLMSFHEAGSDLDRLHRAPAGEWVEIDARTDEVLDWALRVSAASDGRFDPTVAAQQVAWGRLPRPASPWEPDARANWRDIELSGSRQVRMKRPAWIDLGGIAKGYAVDRAVAILRTAGATQVCVNAGGDLRVSGARALAIHLRTTSGISALPALDLRDGAIATSAGVCDALDASALSGTQVHGQSRQRVDDGRGASVLAASCLVADALTKVVLAGDDAAARRVLAQFDAEALTYSPAAGWSLNGAAA